MKPTSQPQLSDAALLTGPRRIAWTGHDLVGRDGCAYEAQFTATAALASGAADAAMIRETFGREPAMLSIDAIRTQFEIVVFASLANHLNRTGGEPPETPSESQFGAETIGESLRAAGFAAGVRILPPFTLTVRCPERERKRLEAAARARAIEAMEHASVSMRRFQQLQREQPDASVDRLMGEIGSTASATLLPTLLKGWAEQRPASEIVVTSGEALIVFSSSDQTWQHRTPPMPQSIGALRTVVSRLTPGAAGRTLLIGGQTGAAIVPLDDPSAARNYWMPPECLSPLGINGLTCTGTHLFATHGAFGLTIWPLDAPATPRLHALPNAKAVAPIDAQRCLVAADGQLWVATTESITRVPKPTDAAVVALLDGIDGPIVLLADGVVGNFPAYASSLHVGKCLGSAVSLATTIDFLGERRLLIANDRGEVEAVGESSRTRFFSPHVGFRKLAAAADWIAALSIDRTRLILWRPWEPQRPAQELHVASLTGHRVTDVAFI